MHSIQTTNLLLIQHSWGLFTLRELGQDAVVPGQELAAALGILARTTLQHLRQHGVVGGDVSDGARLIVVATTG